jgi:LmbE family N-acetylglucosaminyl deacetylase
MLNYFNRRRVARQLSELTPCPLPQQLDLQKANRVLVFVPHPDDETLGCGGTLAILAQRCPVKVVLVTDGSGAGGLPAGSDVVRGKEFLRALDRLGVTDSEQLQQPDGAFTATDALAERVAQLINDYRPNWVFLPSPLDYHRDHVRISAFLEPLCRRAPSIQQILFYEIWAPLPATHVVDITEQFPAKSLALAEHATALACGDYGRAMEGLCRYRGLYLGFDRMAEAFWVEPVTSDGFFRRVQAMAFALLRRVQQ